MLTRIALAMALVFFSLSPSPTRSETAEEFLEDTECAVTVIRTSGTAVTGRWRICEDEEATYLVSYDETGEAFAIIKISEDGLPTMTVWKASDNLRIRP